MFRFFLTLLIFSCYQNVNSQKLIAAYQFQKDTLYRFEFQDRCIIKNSNELRIWMEDSASPMDSALFEYVVYQLGILPKRMFPCGALPPRCLAPVAPISICKETIGIRVCGYSPNDRKKSKSPPCYETVFEEEDIYLKMGFKEEKLLDFEEKDLSDISLIQKKTRAAQLNKIREQWHQEFPTLNEEFYTSIEEIKVHPDSVHYLFLAGQNLLNIPSEIIQFRNLTQLYLQDNQITELPSWLFELKNLRILHLWGNQIQAIPPEISKLEKLEELFLNENPINALPSDFFKLQRLTYLSLSHTHITNISKDFAQFQWLQNLYFRGVPIENIDLELAELYYLEMIAIDDISPVMWKEETAKTLAPLKIQIFEY